MQGCARNQCYQAVRPAVVCLNLESSVSWEGITVEYMEWFRTRRLEGSRVVEGSYSGDDYIMRLTRDSTPTKDFKCMADLG